MAIDELARHELHSRLREALGDDAATTLMEYLPPTGWADVATKRDLDQLAVLTKRDIDELRTEVKHDIDGLRTELKHDIDELRTEVKHDIDGLRTEVKHDIDGLRTEVKHDIDGLRTEVKHDIDDVKRDIAEFRTAVDQRFEASEHRMRSETRAEITAAITSQTRTLLFAVVGSNITVGALAFAAAGLR